jgi:Uncharacterized conserved protein
MEPVIVGVDPGSTSAVAAVDFQGDIKLLESGKNFPPRDIISEIVEAGKPVMVTSDKGETPSKVSKIAASVGAREFVPEKDLSKDRKKELGQGSNSHEKDASAAAIHAFKTHRSGIEEINALSQDMDSDRANVAKKYFKPSENVMQDGQEEKNSESEEGGKNPFKRKAERLEQKVDRLQDEVKEKEESLEFKEQQRRDLQSKYDKLKSGKTEDILKNTKVEKLENKIENKDNKIDKLQERLNKALLREKQYKKAVEEIQEGGKIVPLVEESSPGEEPFVTHSKELRDRMRSKGKEVYHVNEAEGIELGERFVLTEFEDGEDIIERYRSSR